MRLAVIGDEMFVRMFELVGAIGFVVKDRAEAKNTLKKLIEKKDFGIIILPERFVPDTRDIRDKMIREGAYYPLFIFLPDHTGIKGLRIEELKKLISMAVGIELRL